MAATTTSSDTSSHTSQSRDLNPSRSPLPLTASQENQVRELYHKRVRNKCADAVRDFAACATNRTFTATFMCRPQQKAMNTCMKQFATREEMDAAREEWFQTMDKRIEERAAKEKKRQEDEKFWRDWWDKEKKTGDLPPQPAREGKK